MHTADDDSVPVPQEAFTLPRALLNWETPPRRGVADRAELDLDPTPVSGRDPFTASHAEPRASTDALDDDPTIALAIVPRMREQPDAPEVSPARASAHFDAALARAAQLWRDHPLRAAAIVAGVAVITYLAVDGARQRNGIRSQTVLAPAAAAPAARPIIVEQLSDVRQPRETGTGSLRREGKRSAGKRARETSFAATPASQSGGDPAIAPVQSRSKTHQAERSSTTASSSSAGLPAWGAEAVRDFSGTKSSSKAAPVPTRPQPLTAKPTAPSSADIPPAVAADQPSAREQPKPESVVAAKPVQPPEPVLAAKPAEPLAPAAPPPPSKPLTMDQMLNQVEEAAQAQRKKAGLKAPKTSQRDAELDELINGAMQSKKK